MELNYYDTLIAVADDSPVSRSVEPPSGGRKKTVARLEYELLAAHPFTFTQEDILFQTWLARQDFPAPPSEVEIARLREEFFVRPRACLRSSPLPKKHGFGLLFDSQGRVSLCPMESSEYHRLVEGADLRITVRKALRSRRA